MDGRAFEALSKQVAAGSRRGALRVLLGGVAAAAGGQLANEEAGAIFGYCSPSGVPCSRKRQCCSGKCRGGVCGCKKKGKPCFNRVGLNCCSGRCRKGKCK